MIRKVLMYGSKRWLFPLMASLFLVACGEVKKEDVHQTDRISVAVATVGMGMEEYLTVGSGQVTSVNSATLSTRMMGHVERIPVKVGEAVDKGDLLVVINNNDLRARKAQVTASVMEAQASFANAKKDYERYVNLFEKNSASQKELEDMTTRYERAKAGLAAARELGKEVEAQFAYANVRAPFKGVVTNTFVDVGTMANPGGPLISIEKPGTYEVMARIPENRISGIAVGMKAKVSIKVLDTVLTGELTELSTSATRTGGQYLATVELTGTPSSVRSGMYTAVALPKTGVAPKTVVVPKEALVEKGQLIGIYTLGQDNTAILRWLRLGETLDNGVEVLSGLSEGETYITVSQGKLFNGAKVSIQ